MRGCTAALEARAGDERTNGERENEWAHTNFLEGERAPECQEPSRVAQSDSEAARCERRLNSYGLTAPLPIASSYYVGGGVASRDGSLTTQRRARTQLPRLLRSAPGGRFNMWLTGLSAMASR